MKKLIFSILLLASTLLQASDIYVKPGESIADAIRQARELRRLNDPSIEGGITIHVAAGNYRIYEPLFLRPEDSGTPLWQAVRFQAILCKRQEGGTCT